MLALPADHPGAGAGRHDDGVVLGEQVQLGGHHLTGLVREPAGVGGLAAAGLVLRKDHAEAFPFQQGDGVQAGFRHEEVNQAGRIEVNRGRSGRVAAGRRPAAGKGVAHGLLLVLLRSRHCGPFPRRWGSRPRGVFTGKLVRPVVWWSGNLNGALPEVNPRKRANP